MDETKLLLRVISMTFGNHPTRRETENMKFQADRDWVGGQQNLEGLGRAPIVELALGSVLAVITVFGLLQFTYANTFDMLSAMRRR